MKCGQGKYGIKVVHLRDEFPANTDDITWIKELSNRWIGE